MGDLDLSLVVVRLHDTDQWVVDLVLNIVLYELLGGCKWLINGSVFNLSIEPSHLSIIFVDEGANDFVVDYDGLVDSGSLSLMGLQDVGALLLLRYRVDELKLERLLADAACFCHKRLADLIRVDEVVTSLAAVDLPGNLGTVTLVHVDEPL